MKIYLISITLIVLFSAFSSSQADNLPCPCPRIMDPVCGSDRITYSNPCELNCVAKSIQGRSIGLKMFKRGRCSDDRIYENLI